MEKRNEGLLLILALVGIGNVGIGVSGKLQICVFGGFAGFCAHGRFVSSPPALAQLRPAAGRRLGLPGQYHRSPAHVLRDRLRLGLQLLKVQLIMFLSVVTGL